MGLLLLLNSFPNNSMFSFYHTIKVLSYHLQVLSYHLEWIYRVYRPLLKWREKKKLNHVKLRRIIRQIGIK